MRRNRHASSGAALHRCGRRTPDCAGLCRVCRPRRSFRGRAAVARANHHRPRQHREQLRGARQLRGVWLHAMLREQLELGTPGEQVPARLGFCVRSPPQLHHTADSPRAQFWSNVSCIGVDSIGGPFFASRTASCPARTQLRRTKSRLQGPLPQEPTCYRTPAAQRYWQC